MSASAWLTAPLAVRDRRGHVRRLGAQKVARAALVRLLDGNRLDALAYPTTPYEPARLGARQPSANCHLAATTGLPALAVPAGSDRFGGIDLLGRLLSEPVLLRLAAAVHGR